MKYDSMWHHTVTTYNANLGSFAIYLFSDNYNYVTLLFNTCRNLACSDVIWCNDSARIYVATCQDVNKLITCKDLEWSFADFSWSSKNKSGLY